MFDSNEAGSRGGAAELASSVTATNCSFLNNRVTQGEGGALLLNDAGFSDTNGLYRNNSATNGGAVLSESAFLQMQGSRFENNIAISLGGAIQAEVAANLFLSLVILQNNSASQGGAIASIVQTQLTATNCSFSDNTAASNGGALFVDTADATIASSLFSNNMASAGSLLFCRGASEVEFQENTLDNQEEDLVCDSMQGSRICDISGDIGLMCPDQNRSNDSSSLGVGVIIGIVIAAVLGCFFLFCLTVIIFTAKDEDRRIRAKQYWQHLIGEDEPLN